MFPRGAPSGFLIWWMIWETGGGTYRRFFNLRDVGALARHRPFLGPCAPPSLSEGGCRGGTRGEYFSLIFWFESRIGVMLLISNLFLLLVNAVTLRREFSILFNRVAIFILLYSGIIGYDSLYVTYLDTGIGIYNGLFHSTAITHSFDLFIYIIAPIILLLTAFYARRIVQPIFPYNRFEPLGLFSKGYVKAYRNAVMGLDAPQFEQRRGCSPAPTIFSQASKLAYVNRHSIFSRMPLEYPLVILFILIGAILLMSSSDLVSMFLAIELQSYGLYIFATLYRNSEWSTSAGLTYFLLGGPNWYKQSFLFCLQLSNSGDTLKLLVPNCSWNAASGWTNYSCMVISQKIYESIMGYRGSKSDFISALHSKGVKCKLVNGLVLALCVFWGLWENTTDLTHISSLAFTPIRGFSSSVILPLHPLYLAGIIDAEGSFTIYNFKSSRYKVGWQTKAVFSIGLHKKDRVLLFPAPPPGLPGLPGVRLFLYGLRQ